VSPAAAAAGRGCDSKRAVVAAWCASTTDTVRQGLTLVHISAQRKHILRDTLGARCSPSLLDRGTHGGVTKTA
jgi:hypothetical protein